MTEIKKPSPQEEFDLKYSAQFVADGCRYSFAVRAAQDGKQHLRIGVTRAADPKRQSYGFVVPQAHVAPFVQQLVSATKWCDPQSIEDRKQKIREMYPRAYTPWTPEEDEELAERYTPEVSLREIATIFQRRPSALSSRVRKLGLDSR
jgi:hypothetical protein